MKKVIYTQENSILISRDKDLLESEYPETT